MEPVFVNWSRNMETRNARHIAFFLLAALIGNRFLAGVFLDPIRMEAVAPLLDIWSIFALVSVVWIGFSRRPFDNLVAFSPLYWLFCLIALLALYLQGNLVYYAQFKVLRNVFMLGLWLLAAYGMQSHVIAHLKHYRLIQGLIVAVFGVFTLFVVAEIALAWPARTHAYTRTFANNTWFINYGGPVNELGFRDHPAKPSQGKRPKTVLFIGDSFLAGPGIKNIDNRVNGVAERSLDSTWRTVNLGWGGYDTRDEFRTLREFPYGYDAVVLCWLPNDILPVADSLGYHYERQFAYSDLGISGWFIERSFALNYLYWSLPHDDFPEFLPRLKSLYEDPKVWQAHTRDIQQIIDYCAERQIPLFAVIYPYPQNVQATDFATNKVKAYLSAQKIPFLDAASVWRDIPAKDLVLNRNDGHPNKEAQKLVGEALGTMLRDSLMK